MSVLVLFSSTSPLKRVRVCLGESVAPSQGQPPQLFHVVGMTQAFLPQSLLRTAVRLQQNWLSTSHSALFSTLPSALFIFRAALALLTVFSMGFSSAYSSPQIIESSGNTQHNFEKTMIR